MGTFKKVKKNIFVRVDSNKNIGLGHILRILRIFENKNNETQISFVVDHISDVFQKIREVKDCHFISLYNENEKYTSEQLDAKKFVKIISINNKPIIIADDYRLGNKWHKIVKKFTKKLIVIDDLCNRKFYADIYINYKMNTENYIFKKSKKLNKKNTKLLIGNKYCILGKNLKKNCIKKEIVMLNFGNSFDFNNIKKLIKNLIKETIKIYICVGIFSKNYKYIIDLEKKHKNICVIYKKLFIEKYLNEISIFVGSKGNAIYEMSYLNTLSIFFTNTKNQHNNNSDMEKLGHHFFVEEEDLNSKKLTKLIALLLKKNKEIKNLYKNKEVNLDKLGGKRIANIILNEN